MSEYKGENGTHLTQGLFYEFNNPDAPFSLRDTGKELYYVARSGKKYKSFAHLYRSFETEYDFAVSTLGSWDHWKKLMKQKWFMEGVVNSIKFSGLNDWREEKRIAEEALAKKALLKAIEEGSVQAAKIVHDGATKEAKAKAGRPEKKIPSKQKSSVLDIAKRMEMK